MCYLLLMLRMFLLQSRIGKVEEGLLFISLFVLFKIIFLLINEEKSVCDRKTPYYIYL